MNEIERMFKSESQGKKRIGYGAFNKKGKGVKHGIKGGMVTQSSYLTPKQIKELSGEVKIMNNMYKNINNVPSLEAMEGMKKNGVDITKVWLSMREHHRVGGIAEHFGMSVGTMYNRLREIGVEIEQKERAKRVRKIVKEEESNDVLNETFEINIKKETKGEDTDNLINIFAILDKDKTYQISINIKEI